MAHGHCFRLVLVFLKKGFALLRRAQLLRHSILLHGTIYCWHCMRDRPEHVYCATIALALSGHCLRSVLAGRIKNLPSPIAHGFSYAY